MPSYLARSEKLSFSVSQRLVRAYRSDSVTPWPALTDSLKAADYVRSLDSENCRQPYRQTFVACSAYRSVIHSWFGLRLNKLWQRWPFCSRRSTPWAVKGAGLFFLPAANQKGDETNKVGQRWHAWSPVPLLRKLRPSDQPAGFIRSEAPPSGHFDWTKDAAGAWCWQARLSCSRACHRNVVCVVAVSRIWCWIFGIFFVCLLLLTSVRKKKKNIVFLLVSVLVFI